MTAYECDQCGACCKTFPIFADDADAAREPRIAKEAQRLPEHLQTPEFRFRLFPLPFLPACSFLNCDNRCDVYSSRPSVCRAFAAGSEQCQEARARAGLGPLAAAHGIRLSNLADHFDFSGPA